MKKLVLGFGSNVFLPCISDDWVYSVINDKHKFEMECSIIKFKGLKNQIMVPYLIDYYVYETD